MRIYIGRGARRGQGLTEYFFIILLVILLVMISLEYFGYEIADFFDETAYNVQLVADGQGGNTRGNATYSWAGTGRPHSP